MSYGCDVREEGSWIMDNVLGGALGMIENRNKFGCVCLPNEPRWQSSAKEWGGSGDGEFALSLSRNLLSSVINARATFKNTKRWRLRKTFHTFARKISRIYLRERFECTNRENKSWLQVRVFRKDERNLFSFDKNLPLLSFWQKLLLQTVAPID